MTVLAGLDLAWKPGNESGLCLLDADGGAVTLRELAIANEPATALAARLAALGAGVVVAVDAPLIVAEGRRADAALARVFSRFHAAPYQANAEFLARTSGLAGRDLAAALGSQGFANDPLVLHPAARGRHLLEVYPHAAHVALFGLRERILYKKGSAAVRREGLRAYAGHLERLLARDLPAVLAAPEMCALLAAARDPGPGRARKRTEDLLDGVTCAVVAWHAWRHGVGGLALFGDPRSGTIAVPVDPRE